MGSCTGNSGRKKHSQLPLFDFPRALSPAGAGQRKPLASWKKYEHLPSGQRAYEERRQFGYSTPLVLMVRRRLTLDNAEGLFWLSAKLIGWTRNGMWGVLGLLFFG